ncbi:hypothetical protein [Pseudoxanthomonas kaohsiungensis]|uniref:OmpA-like domain-containing protein n=1 Tax=Pseudoxanthomonas kaohsiungensis TaxID=283923 RepID=A0ABW3LUW5_9GAMM|nr:hypothetical protein [Pseudoxanthomonas kaohsiungensis]KAF1704191.1 hypothetical protein CSC66_04890 [Pseudoxanthomonas kaohsiungensis]
MSRLLTILLAACLALASVSVRAADDADVARLQARMDTLQADPAVGRMAAFEQMEARQAIARLDDARRSERAGMLYVAERRVEIAETAAAAESARRELAALDLQRSELLLQASRRDAERARQEAERLRIQSQIQAEEAERLRLAAEAEAAARTDVEQALTSVTGKQTAQLSAARRKEAQLARQEAELVSGAKLPPSTFESRGEVFTLPAAAFAQSRLSADGQAGASALAAYLQIGKRGKVRVDGYDKDAQVARARGEALKAALVAGGVPAGQVQAAGKTAGASAKKAAEVIVAP